MGQKRNPAQTQQQAEGETSWFAYEGRIELESCFMPTWMQVDVQTVMNILTHILLSYM